MSVEEKYIKSYDGELIYAKEYITDNPQGVVILTHDLKEHSALYENFALTLQNNNYNVFTYDLRAHKNSAQEPFGTYSEDFFNDCLRDLIFINKYLQKKYSLPLINLGVGLGSILLIRTLQFFKESKLNIFIGMPYDRFKLYSLLMRTTTKLKIMFINKNSDAKLTNRYLNYILSNKFEDKNYQSSNKEYIEKITNDKFCNFYPSANLLNSVFRGNFNTFLNNNLNKIDKETNMLFLSGQFDRLTNFTKSTKKFKEHLIKQGFKNINSWTIKDMRHNVLNETNTKIVSENLINYINDKLN